MTGQKSVAQSAPSRSLPRNSLVDDAYEDLYARIADGVLPPGERLVIDRIAADFATSTIPVREALARLLATKLVIFEPNRGYSVAPRPTVEQIRHLFETRLVIEMGAMDIGITSANKAILSKLETINRKIKAGQYGKDFAGFREFVDLNEKFHIHLVQLANNPLLLETYRHLGYHQQTFRYNSGRGIPDLALIVKEHDDIIAALRGHDIAQARAALTHHIRDAYARLVATSDPEQGNPAG